MIFFFTKKRVKTLETLNYQWLLINTLIMPILEIVCYIALKQGIDCEAFIYIFLNDLLFNFVSLIKITLSVFSVVAFLLLFFFVVFVEVVLALLCS